LKHSYRQRALTRSRHGRIQECCASEVRI